ncbi:MAG: hypothetical protein FWE32_00500 [Oscillospiraceae bacterium]|nr:hypothetical protein [Oscillospiraceae bacterium]
MNQTSYREITQTMTFQYKPATVIHLPRILSQKQREKVAAIPQRINPAPTTHTTTKSPQRRNGNSMQVTETFKAQSDDDRREAVTRLMIQLENNKQKQTEATNQPKAG